MNTASAIEVTSTMAILPLSPEQFRLVKTSQQGRRYYFKRFSDGVEVVGGSIVDVAETGLFQGDAYHFSSEFSASQVALALNSAPVSEALWIVEPADV